jgi:hypothetical protein
MLKTTISKSASRAVAESRGFFEAKTGPMRRARLGQYWRSLRIWFAENGRQNPTARSWHLRQDRAHRQPSRPCGANNPGSRRGACRFATVVVAQGTPAELGQRRQVEQCRDRHDEHRNKHQRKPANELVRQIEGE